MRVDPVWKKRLAIAAGLAATLAVAAAAGLWLKRRVDASRPDAAPAAPPAAQASELPYERVFDWNDAGSPLAGKLAPFVTERLGLQREARLFQPILAKAVEIVEDTAFVVLRRDVYWSDGAALKAQQVIEAFARAKSRGGGEGVKPLWLTKVGVESATAEMLKGLEKRLEGAPPEGVVVVRGFDDASDLHALLAHRIMSPIRPDLVGAGGSDEGWRVTIGRYRLRAIPARPLTEATVLGLDPNPSYFRGPAVSALELTLRDLVESPR